MLHTTIATLAVLSLLASVSIVTFAQRVDLASMCALWSIAFCLFTRD